jgi:clan AA aspartic protease (TIGR02281 family)
LPARCALRIKPGLETPDAGRRMSIRTRLLRLSLGSLVAVLVCGPASAEIYHWTDENGRLHFSQDLAKVPPAQREQAKRDAALRKQRDPLQVYGSSPGAGAETPGRSAQRPGRTMRIPFERQGTLMRVEVLLNDRVRAPFYIDPGASGVSIPWSVARELGLQIHEETPRIRVQTANGVVSEPVVTLRSVQLGPARVANLEAAVSGSMQIGLLGGAFFNNYVYQVDAAAGVISLAPNTRVRGGLDQSQWRERFDAIRDPLIRLEAYLEAGGFTSESRVQELEAHREKLRASLEELEREANRHSVPPGWRE